MRIRNEHLRTWYIGYMHFLIRPSILLLGVLAGITHADLADLSGTFANDLEEAAAVANQETYNSLRSAGCIDQQRTETPACGGTTFGVFENVRELVHTANELSGNGPTQYSLQSDIEGLGFALRWTAGEEFAAQGSLTSDFVNGQLSGLASRLTALRFGATGFSVAGLTYDDRIVAIFGRARLKGGGASADDSLSSGYSRWSGFINGAYGFGDKDTTVLEDAFDFDGYQINGGIDHRVNDNWVLGVVLGYTEQEIDFDSSKSIVDGGVKSAGYSIMPFVLYQSEHLFSSLSAGYQQMDLDTDRAIRYPSFNPDVASADTRTLGSTDADTISLFGSLGYTITEGAFAVEPYIEATYLDIAIDGFVERDLNNESFDFEVEDQNIRSKEISFGLSLQYSLTPSFGVFIPNIDIQWRNQFQQDSRNISATYAGSSSSVNFNLATDELDDQYYVISAGLTTLLRGGRQIRADGPVSGGIHAFVTYKIIEDLENFSQEVISGGIRYEF